MSDRRRPERTGARTRAVPQRKGIPFPLLICIAVGVLLVALALNALFRFPVKRYVREALDAVCRSEFDEYGELVGASDSEVSAWVREELGLTAEAFAAYFGMENVSDQSMDLLREFSRDVYGRCRYKVKGCRRGKDGYEVTVKIKPVLFDELAKDQVKAYVEEFNARSEDGEFLYDSDPIYEEKFLKGLLEVYDEALADAPRGKWKKVRVTVKKSGAKRYEHDLSPVLNQLIEF